MTFNIIRPDQCHGFTRPMSRAEPDDIYDPHVGASVAMSARIAEVLFASYPGHPWRVVANTTPRREVFLVHLEGFTQWPFFINVKDIQTENAFTAMVKQAGGEFLERYRMPRSGFSLEHWIRAHDLFETHINQRKLAA